MAEGRKNWPAVADDWFVEPIAATTFLLEREPIRGPVWDPCCGMGNIVAACKAHGLEAVGTDLRSRSQRATWDGRLCPTANFLEFPAPNLAPEVRTIMMNPPYGNAKLAEAFIRHALTFDVDKVCAFVNAKFLFGAGRAKGLFKDHPPMRVYPVTPRPSCPPGEHILDGGKVGGGVENFAWIVWAPGRVGDDTRIVW